jgi:hypothetical protein
MLTAYRRHSDDCPLKSMGQRKCKCPVWVNGRIWGKLIRKSLKTRNWETAQKFIRDWERDGEPKGVSMSEGSEKFLEYLTGENLKPPTLWKYEMLMEEMKKAFRGNLEGISIVDLQPYQASWKLD